MSRPLPAQLLKSKLHIPLPGGEYVARERLLHRLDACARVPLTLLAAPAGFGKTTLLAAWSARHTKMRVTWLALEPPDDDAARFLAYLCAALARIDAARVQEVRALLELVPPPAPLGVLAALLNAFADFAEPFVLVLDDAHVLESNALQEALAFLVEHCPPNLHLIIATRADPPLPLARLRARGQLNEIRLPDLRFTFDETLAFLNDAQKLNLARAEIHALETRTEGWIAGLQLAGLSLRTHADRASFIAMFSGSHRFVLDYLIEQVLSQQTVARQTFLMETALLTRVNGSLANAVTGRRDGQAQLEWLETHNLFLIPLDDARAWFRYHQLFAEFLQHRLRAQTPARAQDIYRRAAAWHAEHGEPADAIEYALAAKAFEFAAQVLEQQFDAYWTRGEFATLARWFEKFPPRLFAEHPRLQILRAWHIFLSEKYARGTLAPHLDAAEKNLKRLPVAQRRELRGMIAAVRASDSGRFADTQPTIAFAQAALRALPHKNVVWRLNSAMALANAYEWSGQVKPASEAFARVIELSKQTGNTFTRMVAMRHLATLYALQCRFDDAVSMYARVIADMEQSFSAEAASGAAQVGLGEIWYLRNELTRAEEYLRAGIARAAARQETSTQIEATMYLTLLQRARGDAAAMTQSARQVEQLLNVPEARFAAFPTDAFRAYVALALGEPERERVWAVEIARRKTHQGRLGEFEASIAARVLLASEAPELAAQLGKQLWAAARQEGRTLNELEGAALRAAACFQLQRTQQAHTALRLALELAAPVRILRYFIDLGQPMRALLQAYLDAAQGNGSRDARLRAFAKIVLAAFTLSPPPSPAALLEPLSAREIQVLRLVVNGASNQEIARTLVIALSTVKAHTNTIYAKFGVSSRSQAIRRAHELNLV